MKIPEFQNKKYVHGCIACLENIRKLSILHEMVSIDDVFLLIWKIVSESN